MFFEISLKYLSPHFDDTRVNKCVKHFISNKIWHVLEIYSLPPHDIVYDDNFKCYLTTMIT